MGARVMLMAGGTGGHVFPALAVARELRDLEMEVLWLGVRGGFEEPLVLEEGLPFNGIEVRGLRGNGLRRWLGAPVSVGRAVLQAREMIRRARPRVVLGMGGFAAGPGGVAAWMQGIPVLIHEQNAVPGLTNRVLARFASRVMEAFPGSFSARPRTHAVGNPVRREILELPGPESRMHGREGPLCLLVTGGSQGAQALNDTVPRALASIPEPLRPMVIHQAGSGKEATTAAAYQAAGVKADVVGFVGNVAEAYGWADLVICRAGALTVSELAVAGLGSILVPYPHAVDDHQTRNAEYLVKAGAAQLLPQSELSPERLAESLRPHCEGRNRLRAMAFAARSVARPHATETVARIVQEALI